MQKIGGKHGTIRCFRLLECLYRELFTDDRGCAHCDREHTLIYIHSGELEITERGRKTVLHPGECAFMRRDNRMWLIRKGGRKVSEICYKVGFKNL